MKGRVLVCLLFVLVGSAAAAQSNAPAKQCVGASTLVYSDTVAFFLDAPTGWVLDCNAGKGDGVLTALYRTGETWRTGQAVMYANVLTPKGAPVLPFAERIQGEVADWTARVPDAKVVVRSNIPLKVGKAAVVRQFSSVSKGLYEIVAYVPRGRVTPILAMTARSSVAFEQALPAFERLVRSYAPGPTVQVR
jgi:hypothetical protein